MRFLGVGNTIDLNGLYQRLAERGHAVRVYAADYAPEEQPSEIIERTADWQKEIEWLRAAGKDGIALFETCTRGAQQDALRRAGLQVIGGSELGDRLESDRAFGQSVMRQVGMRTAGVYSFDDFDRAIAFVRSQKRRFVFKLDGGYAPFRNFIGVMEDGQDVVAMLMLQRARLAGSEPPRFILMDHVSGVEVGVGAYFNGEDFLRPACLDWEHKRLFPGDLGELTGEMGTLVTYRDSEKLFQETLGRMTGALRKGGYCGYININTIVNDDGVWPLEFTARFGYPGYAILSALHKEPWEDLFARMVQRRDLTFRTHPGYAVGVVLTVPPFPYSQGYADLSLGSPILFRGELSDAERANLHFEEVAYKDGQLVCAGQGGYLMVVTGRGATVKEAQRRAYQLAAKVVAPNLRYRNDIGTKFRRRDHAELVRLGWLSASVRRRAQLPMAADSPSAAR